MGSIPIGGSRSPETTITQRLLAEKCAEAVFLYAALLALVTVTLVLMKRNTKAIGDRSESRVLAAFIDAGFNVSIPFGENHRYDFVVEDEEGRLLKIQVKTGRKRDGVIRFNGYSSHAHRGGSPSRLYRGEGDFFAIYCPQTNDLYLVPESEVSFRPYLRIDPPRNNMKKTVRWAADFSFQKGSGASDVFAPPPELRFDLGEGGR